LDSQRLQARNGATPAFRVWGLAASRDRKDGARVLSVALAADDKQQTSRQMVLVMSMAVERGLLPAAVMTAARGDVRFELGRSAPVWCPPCLAVASPTTTRTGEAALDAEAQTTVAVLKGDPAVDSAAAAALAVVMRRARSEALEVVGLRYVWLSAAQAATAANTTTHRPPASGGPIVAVALRGRDAVRALAYRPPARVYALAPGF